MTDFSGISISENEIIDFLRRDLRLKQICRELLAQRMINHVAEEHGVNVTGEEVQAELDRISYENQFNHPAQLLAWISEEMTSLSEFKQRVQDDLVSKNLARQLFLDQVREVLNENPKSFEQLVIYQITVPYESLAREIFYQIEEEEISFYEAAHLYNTREKARLHCGYEGKSMRQQLPEGLAEILSDVRAGEVIGPIQLPDSYYAIFLVDDLISPSTNPSLEEEILGNTFQAWVEENLERYLAELKRPS